jgi:uncharacterized membrane protein YdjX (TVP38/TMEM64 family)
MANKKVLIWLAVAATIIGLGLIIFLWVIPNFEQIKNVFSSQEKLRAWIESLGVWGPLMFLAVQLAQIVIAPIPGNLVGIVGGAMFGLWWGFLLSAIGTILGATLAFWLARWLGARWVIKLIGEKNYRKYEKAFEGRISWTLVIIFLIPFFPDDILCILAGLSPLAYPRFLVLVILGRLPSVFINNAVGAGLLNLPEINIPVWVWISGGAIVLGFVVAYFLNRQKVNQWLERKLLGTDKDLTKIRSKDL